MYDPHFVSHSRSSHTLALCQSRWEPVISEYKETALDQPQSQMAARLLSTLPPNAKRELMEAANKLMGL